MHFNVVGDWIFIFRSSIYMSFQQCSRRHSITESAEQTAHARLCASGEQRLTQAYIMGLSGCMHNPFSRRHAVYI